MNKDSTHMKLLFLMMLVACLTGVTSDIYTPSFGAIADDLAAPIEKVQWSMAIFMLGVSLSQLVYGPLSEGVGRRQPLLAGLAILILGSVGCFFAGSINQIIAFRLVQGLGAGACACLWRSIFRDSFDSTQMAKYGAYLGIAMTFVVAAAPALGGCLHELFGWRASFCFLILYALCTTLAVVFLFKETSQHHHLERLSFSFFSRTMKELISSRVFIGYTLCTFFTYGAFFSWFVVGPVLLIEKVGISPATFGWFNLCLGGSAMMLAGIANGKWVGVYGRYFMLRLGWSLMLLSGTLMLLLQAIFGVTLLSVTAPIFLFFFGATFIWPSAFAGAFAPFGKIAGYTGALYSFMQIGGGAVIGWLSSFLPDDSQWPFALLVMLASACAWILFEQVIVKEKKGQPLDQ